MIAEGLADGGGDDGVPHDFREFGHARASGEAMGSGPRDSAGVLKRLPPRTNLFTRRHQCRNEYDKPPSAGLEMASCQ
jgi:hypothetical protein